MKLIPQTPKKALNKAFLKQRPLRAEMDLFKENLITLLGKIDEIEREENQKNHVRDFLLNTYYKNTNEVNTKGTQDLVIHNGKDNKSSVGVIIEAKRPTNKSEWISVEKPNGKAFQELVLYYLRERIEENNIDLKYLIATNINEWYIFEASYFEKTFYQNKKFVKEYEEWRDGKKVTKDTKLFYNEIAKPFIDSLQTDIECTFFNIKDYEKVLKNESLEDDKNLIALLKILSPNHLLKVPFANDSNSLDKDFYLELLHLIGLKESKEGGKKLIQRQPEGSRNEGSLLENAINQLESHDKILRINTPSQYGNTHQERLFNVGLELVITWMNRILFLKLLEAQLLTYHKGDKKYAFLNLDKIKDYDELDKLFFSVLAKKVEERSPKINELFGLVPYLNSSLFEPTELEHQTLFINALDGNLLMPFYSSSILTKDKKRKDTLNGIAYLFEFLNAYDFSSDGNGDIQEDNKRLINASVLGLIFEKINGYKDGSFFTPGFITMYMCKETIRRSVVQKFKEANYKLSENTDIETNFKELYDQIENRKEANEIINSLKICDPAVGSGHFLVSALNELIAIKSDLKILTDKEGKRLKEYHVEVVNDELVVTDEDGELYEYYPNNKESQRIQETLFHEKQTIIENCLFGVDINPNSVKICRLRLWVELLKNAYYKQENKQLETLPNIDINIKCGNSLISRFSLDADLKQALKKSKWNVESYQIAVQTYRHAQSKEEKWEMEKLIKDIKSDFRTEINKNDPKLGKLYKLKGELFNLTNQQSIFGMTPKEKKDFDKKVKELTTEIDKLETEIEEIKSNKIYGNAFEWRFEFPEVLNNDGDFVGFDVVIGNPPYMLLQNLKKDEEKNLKKFYKTANYKGDTFGVFIEHSFLICKKAGLVTFIVPYTWMTIQQHLELRRLVLSNGLLGIIDLPHKVFDNADLDTTIIHIDKSYQKDQIFIGEAISEKIYPNTIGSKERFLSNDFLQIQINLNPSEFELINKIKSDQLTINDYFEVSQGYIPYRRSDLVKKYGEEKGNLIVDNREWHSNFKISDEWKQEIQGRDLMRYSYCQSQQFVKYGKHVAGYVDEKFFKSSRILIMEVTRGDKYKISATYVDEEYYNTPSIINIISKNSKVGNLYCLLGFLNSRLMTYYHLKNHSKALASTSIPKILVGEIRNIPVNINLLTNEILNAKVNQILTLKKTNPSADTSALEKEIDQLVYELYGLTDEEIKIIENEGK